MDIKRKIKYSILIQPLVSEKSLRIVDELNQYTFEVDKRAKKQEIKKEVLAAAITRLIARFMF